MAQLTHLNNGKGHPICNGSGKVIDWFETEDPTCPKCKAVKTNATQKCETEAQAMSNMDIVLHNPDTKHIIATFSGGSFVENREFNYYKSLN